MDGSMSRVAQSWRPSVVTPHICTRFAIPPSPDTTSHHILSLLTLLPQYAEQIIARLKDENGVLRYKVCSPANDPNASRLT